jgi:hypothetical protein
MTDTRPTEPRAETKPTKLAVIVTESQHFVYANGEVERYVKLFDLPAEVADYIARTRKNQYASISLALQDETI